jgi:hypothetical protein
MITRTQGPRRTAAASVELAVLLPFLAFIFVISVDWARVFYYTVIITNCARNGAVYASDPITQPQSRYSSLSAAALADAPDLSPAPTVTSSNGADTQGSYVEVTVSYPFTTVSNFPGVPNNTTLARTVRMYIQPTMPH